MNRLNVDVVTFNDNERDAVDSLFDDIINSTPNVWRANGLRALKATVWTGSSRRDLRIRHVPLGAQGNVVAGAALARFFEIDPGRPDFMVFYGCAGGAERAAIGDAFLVASVNYTSLGTVDAALGCGHEAVTLKNKWICHTQGGPTPLPSEDLSWPLGPPLDLARRTLLTPAHVVASEQVVHVRPGAPPPPQFGGLPHPLYARADWTYAQAIAVVAAAVTPTPVLVDMESYGVGTMAEAHNLLDRVVIVRVVTDDLLGHATPNKTQVQRGLLMTGKTALLSVMKALLFP